MEVDDEPTTVSAKDIKRVGKDTGEKYSRTKFVDIFIDFVFPPFPF